MAGPRKWNRQQGLYVYRAGRMVQSGGWGGLRAIDEHMKFARASLDFDTDLDEVFNINVAKIRVSVPAQLKLMLERPVHELCARANESYRRTVEDPRDDAVRPESSKRSSPATPAVGLALRAAAMQAGEYAALKRILTTLKVIAPEEAAALGATG